ncbi:MAG: hypothetical protein V2I32_15080, partial [Desulforhopalus sp.]|nr:hypothetical protein [Desulforhopalus sp.]
MNQLDLKLDNSRKPTGFLESAMNLLGNWTWQGLGNALFNPKAHNIDAKISAVKQRLPIPVFWLLGKAQSGKTSLIKALTGDGAVEIGNGFQACTKRSRLYD